MAQLLVKVPLISAPTYLCSEVPLLPVKSIECLQCSLLLLQTREAEMNPGTGTTGGAHAAVTQPEVLRQQFL